MRRVVVAVLVSVLLAQSAAGQGGAAPDLSPASATLYAHHNDADTAELTGWMNTIETEGDDEAVGTGTCATGLTGNAAVDEALGQGPESSPADRTYTFTIDPALAIPVTLDKARPAQVTIAFGAGTCFGDVQLTSTLTLGGTTVAKAGPIAHSYEGTGSGNPYPTTTFDMPVLEGTWDIGQPLKWTIHIGGEWGGNGFVGVAPPQGRTFIVLPVTGVGFPAKVLPAGPVDIQETFNTTTTKLLRYTWAGPATAQAFTYTTTGTGNATFKVLDSANATLLNQSVQGAKTATKTATGAAGNWSISIALSDFNGTVRFTINNPSGIPGTGGNGTSTNSGTGAAGNGTDDGDGKDTPVPALPALLGAIAAAVILARRRR